MKMSRILLLILLSNVGVTYTEQTPVQENQVTLSPEEQEAQEQYIFFLQCYELITKSCKSVKLELLKNKIEQLTGACIQLIAKQQESSADFSHHMQALATACNELEIYLKNHHAKHNSLEQLPDTKFATLVVVLVSIIKSGMECFQECTNQEEALGLQEGIRKMNELLPTFFSYEAEQADIN